MIGKHKNFEFTALQVVAPGLKSFNYGQQFLIVCFVPSLCRNHFSRDKGYRLALTSFQGKLAQNTTYGIAGSIYFNSNITFQMKMVKDRGFCKGLLQSQKG